MAFGFREKDPPPMAVLKGNGQAPREMDLAKLQASIQHHEEMRRLPPATQLAPAEAVEADPLHPRVGELLSKGTIAAHRAYIASFRADVSKYIDDATRYSEGFESWAAGKEQEAVHLATDLANRHAHLLERLDRFHECAQPTPDHTTDTSALATPVSPLSAIQEADATHENN